MLDKLYSEGCNFVRHYSNCSLNVRNAALVQGLVLVSACGYIFETLHNPLYLILAALFGLFLTLLLYNMHAGYVRAADTYADATAKVEQRLDPDGGGPVAAYERVREGRYRSTWFRFISIHATFTVITLPFLVFLVLGVIYACR